MYFLVAIAAVAVAAAALGDGGEAVAGEEDQRAAALGEVFVHDAPRREETALAVVAVPAALVAFAARLFVPAGWAATGAMGR